jgi:hypothetical protein
LNSLFIYLSEVLKFELPCKKLLSKGTPITDIAQIYSLPEDTVLVFAVDGGGPPAPSPKPELTVQVRFRLAPDEERSVKIAVPENATVGQLRETIAQRPEFSGRLLQILTDDRQADDTAPVRGSVDVRFGVQVQLVKRKRTVWLFQNPSLVTVDALLSQYATQYGVPHDAITVKQAEQTVSADTKLVDVRSDSPLVFEGLESPPSGNQFRFLLPDGTVETRSLDDTRTFASLAADFPNFPNIRFFDGDEEIDRSARISSLTRREMITVRIVYQFMCRHWEEPRAKAFVEDVTVGEAAADLTGRNANEFIVTYADNVIPASDPISSVEYVKGQHFVLTRVFPVKFKVEGSDRIFEHRFNDDCTFHVMKEILARDHPEFKPVFHPDWIQQAEIYAVLDSKEVIILKKIPDPEESSDPIGRHAEKRADVFRATAPGT